MEASGLSPPNSQSIPLKLSSSLSMKSFFQFIVYYYEAPEEAQSQPQCCWSGDGSATIKPGQKARRSINLSPIYNHEPSPSAVSAQIWAPHKMLTGAPLMVIYEKIFRRYATSRCQMAFKTKYPNCTTQFWQNRARSQVLRFGEARYIFRSDRF